MFVGKKTYSEFQYSPEKISTNILAGRLKRLIEYQIIIKSAYQKNPVRYEYSLTVEGEELGPILKEMIWWGEKHITNCKAFIKSQKESLD